VATLTLYKQEFLVLFCKKERLSSVCRIDRAALARATLIATWYKVFLFVKKKQKLLLMCWRAQFEASDWARRQIDKRLFLPVSEPTNAPPG
jgi:hypothetical protein